MYKTSVMITFYGEPEDILGDVARIEKEFGSRPIYGITKYPVEKTDEYFLAMGQQLNRKISVGERVKVCIDDLVVMDNMVVREINPNKNNEIVLVDGKEYN